MLNDFKYDVFLSHSAKDKSRHGDGMRELANRLKKDKLRVWFDEWEMRSSDSISTKIEEGLEDSRMLVLCTSANAFGFEWVHLEAGTFRFRDSLNQERRFIPLRLDDAPIQRQFLHLNWLPQDREQEYGMLLEACQPLAKQTAGRSNSMIYFFETNAICDVKINDINPNPSVSFGRLASLLSQL